MQTLPGKKVGAKASPQSRQLRGDTQSAEKIKKDKLGEDAKIDDKQLLIRHRGLIRHVFPHVQKLNHNQR